MSEFVETTRWNEYVQTPCRTQAPVKLEHIAQQRIQAFLRAKRVKKHLNK
jgi:hypothetical protein